MDEQMKPTGIKKLNQLRYAAASAGSGVINVSIDDLNDVYYGINFRTKHEKDIELIRTALAECKELYDDSTTDGHYKLLVAADEALDRIASGGVEKTLAQLLREENDRLSFKMKNNAIRGKTFTMEEAQKLHEDRHQELLDIAATGRLNASHTGGKTDE